MTMHFSIESAQESIRFNTVNPPGSERPCAVRLKSGNLSAHRASNGLQHVSQASFRRGHGRATDESKCAYAGSRKNAATRSPKAEPRRSRGGGAKEHPLDRRRSRA